MTTRRPPPLRRAVSDEDKERRRTELMAAGRRVFAEHGFQAATMADVARAAGVSYGVVYWYFDSKDELFHALMTAEADALRGRIEAAVAAAPPGDLRAGMRAAVGATFAFFADDREAATLLFRDASLLGTAFEKHLFSIYGRFLDDLTGVLQDSQDRGAVRRAPPRLVAFSVASLVTSVALRRLRTDDGLDVDGAADLVVDLLFEGLGP
ncbi:MAG: TetR/AcrR family transcriptional regulator [Acidimicrobiales bacterium]